MLGRDMIPIEIIFRENFIDSSTFPVEIVTCKTSKGKNISLFCKYLEGMGPNSYGHRRGVDYEAFVKVYDKEYYYKWSEKFKKST